MSNLADKPAKVAANQGPRWIWLGTALLTAFFAWAVYFFAFYRKPVAGLDSFARCLTANDVKMYGAWWCPHCADQKQIFGQAFRYLDYVECSPPGQRTENQVCRQAGIKDYPTWQFADGLRAEGTQSLAVLSQRSGCRLP
jgi:hypothetical protein